MHKRNTAVAIIINPKGQILCLHNIRNNFATESVNTDIGSWKLPQGGIEAGEDIIEAITRELSEELGWSLEPGQLARHTKKTHSYYFVNEDKPDFEVCLHPVSLKLDKVPLIKLDQDEHDRYIWCDAKKFSTLNLGIRKEAYSAILKDYKIWD